MALRSLERFGLCTMYADESDDKFIYAIACVAVPTLIRRRIVSVQIDWDQYLAGAKRWRQTLRHECGIPISKELKGSKLANGHNSYGRGGARLQGAAAFTAYQNALRALAFLPPGSIFSVYTVRGVRLSGYRKLETAFSEDAKALRRLEVQLASLL